MNIKFTLTKCSNHDGISIEDTKILTVSEFLSKLPIQISNDEIIDYILLKGDDNEEIDRD